MPLGGGASRPESRRVGSGNSRNRRTGPGRAGARDASPSEAARAAAAGHISTTAPGGASRKPGGTSSARAGLSGPSTKVSRSDSGSLAGSSPTRRSAQPSRPRTNWRIGSASRNSLATSSSGPSGSPSMPSAKRGATSGSEAARRRCCSRRSTGLASTRNSRKARRNSGAARDARSRSAISVPRPGPSSARITGSGCPMRRQKSMRQAPISSPNIWLISGAVTKSPAAPSGSRLA